MENRIALSGTGENVIYLAPLPEGRLRGVGMGERFIARVVSTFKITIPAEIRELRNVEVGDFVELELLRVIKRGRGPRPAREGSGDEGGERASGGRVLSSDPQAGTRTGPDEQLVSELPGTEPGAERLTARLAEVVE